MKICFVGLDNLPVLAPEYGDNTVGGESVQQTLLARAFARAGHQVSMVVADYGQADGATWDAVRTLRAYAPRAGLPVVRFVHPRWTGLWAALKRADADLYYTSCAGMHVGLLAAFCRRHAKRFVFRAASDSDCDPSRLLVRYARDRWLYALGLRRADAILVQSTAQASALRRNYALDARVAGMLVEPPRQRAPQRDIDVLWISNIRQVKRPDRLLVLADRFPRLSFHMVGGPLKGEESLFRDVGRAAALRSNLFFHGRLSYRDTSAVYARARVLVNTSDVEGFPNAYLQAWMNGVPVITRIDPDGIIAREGLGLVERSLGGMGAALDALLRDPAAPQVAGARCRAFMQREYAEDRILIAYAETFRDLLRGDARRGPGHVTENPSHA